MRARRARDRRCLSAVARPMEGERGDRGGGEEKRLGGWRRRRERGRGKIIIFEVDDEATGEETNLSRGSPEFLVAGIGDPLRDERFESLPR